MKKLNIILPIVLGAALLIAASPDEKKHATLEPGDQIPKSTLNLIDISGKDITLKEITGKNGLLVIFSCNTCPFVVGNPEKGTEGWEGRYKGIMEHCSKQNVGMVLVNSNEAKREAGDSFSDMVVQAEKQGYTCHYVLDEGSQLANAFGAKTTPHVFLFDRELKLAYRGAIDDNVASSDKVEKHYLAEAIENMVQKKPIDPNQTKAIGCSIKRVDIAKK